MASQITDTTSSPHFSPVKLSSSTFLIWRNHMTLLMALHKLSAHIDGSSPPSENVTTDNKTEPNPDYASWLAADQKPALLLLSSLTEEAATEVLGITGARKIWITLENTYSNASIERVQSLRDSLQQLTKGSSSIMDFSRKFNLYVNNLLRSVIRLPKQTRHISFFEDLALLMKVSPSSFETSNRHLCFGISLSKRKVTTCSLKVFMAPQHPLLPFMPKTNVILHHKTVVMVRIVVLLLGAGVVRLLLAVTIIVSPVVNYVGHTATTLRRV
ncbi:hypothetical protein Hdeb2414_s0007g00256151 [Helianthus debilis subsp. tardiflorus]